MNDCPVVCITRIVYIIFQDGYCFVLMFTVVQFHFIVHELFVVLAYCYTYLLITYDWVIFLLLLDLISFYWCSSLMPSVSCDSADMSVLTDQAARLLDFSQKLDIQLLDNIIGFMYGGAGQQVTLLKLLF